MGFVEELKDYTSNTGLIQPAKGQDSNNGVLYLSEAVVIAHLLNATLPNYSSPIRACFKEPGLLQRNPDGSGGQEGPDDYIGLAALIFASGEITLAEKVIKYGWSHWGFYNNADPGKWSLSSFLVRQPALVTAFYFIANRKPLFLLRIITAIILATSGKKNNPDSWILSWLLLQIMINNCWMSRVAHNFWVKRLLREWPGGMPEVTGQYFEPGHPLIKYWPKY